jgi:membrane protease YdiL (CAAX protease family)
MTPVSVYPIPESSTYLLQLTVTIVSAAFPIYLLIFRPTGNRRFWDLSEISALTMLFLFTWPIIADSLDIQLPFDLTRLTAFTIVQNTMFVAVSLYVACIRFRLPASTLGFRADGLGRGLALGLLAGAIALPLSIAGEAIAVRIFSLIEGAANAAARVAAEHADDPIQPILQALAGAPLPTAWIVFLLAVIVPIGEEVFFRGFVYSGLRERWGVAIAIFSSSLFFTLVHVQVVHGFPIFLLGVLFAWLFQSTGNLVPGIIAHGINNLIAVLATLNGWSI